MPPDPETSRLFQESNFDAFDSSSDRYSAVLRAGLKQHGLELPDVLAVTQDLGLWAICRTGVFSASLRGVFKKRVEVGELIAYSQVASVRQEPSGPHTARIVLTGSNSKDLARIDFSAGGMDNTPEKAAAFRDHVYEVLRQALG